jgi:hypothetical protein
MALAVTPHVSSNPKLSEGATTYIAILAGSCRYWSGAPLARRPWLDAFAHGVSGICCLLVAMHPPVLPCPRLPDDVQERRGAASRATAA